MQILKTRYSDAALKDSIKFTAKSVTILYILSINEQYKIEIEEQQSCP